MTFEEKILAGYIPDMSRLGQSGFVFEEGAWRASIPFMDGDFTAEITVSEGGEVSGKVIDAAAGEEYLPLRSGSRVGPYVSYVRDAYAVVLTDLAGRCFVRRPFMSDQANRVAGLVREEFGEDPDFPFTGKDVDSAGVFRNAGNRRWYAIVMSVARKKLAGETSDEPVDVMNVKHDEEEIPKLLKTPGVYPAYHMQKRCWVSLILDGTLGDGFVMDLIRRSRDFTAGRSAAGGGSGSAGLAPRSWVIPANPKIYDIEGEMAAYSGETWWHQSADIRAGDHVYVYVASPVKAILWRFRVTRAGVPLTDEETAEFKSKWSKKMILELDRSYDRALTGFETLKAHGLTAVRGARRVPDALVSYLDGLPV